MEILYPYPTKPDGKLFPGITKAISNAAKTREEAINYVAAHEACHHVHRYGGLRAKKIIDESFANTGRNPITIRANRDAREYWAETYTAYIYHPNLLKSYDEVGYKMIQDVMSEWGVKK